MGLYEVGLNQSQFSISVQRIIITIISFEITLSCKEPYLSKEFLIFSFKLEIYSKLTFSYSEIVIV